MKRAHSHHRVKATSIWGDKPSESSGALCFTRVSIDAPNDAKT
jgi:hypothetical protein